MYIDRILQESKTFLGWQNDRIWPYLDDTKYLVIKHNIELWGTWAHLSTLPVPILPPYLVPSHHLTCAHPSTLSGPIPPPYLVPSLHFIWTYLTNLPVPIPPPYLVPSFHLIWTHPSTLPGPISSPLPCPSLHLNWVHVSTLAKLISKIVVEVEPGKLEKITSAKMVTNNLIITFTYCQHLHSNLYVHQITKSASWQVTSHVWINHIFITCIFVCWQRLSAAWCQNMNITYDIPSN